jgi:nucleotide-binding universal stress UspA family protein
MPLAPILTTRELVMTPPILLGVDPVHHDPDAPVLAALLARATSAPVIAIAAYGDETARTLADADHVHALRGDAMARLSAVEGAFHGLVVETEAVAGPSAARVLHDCAEARGAGLLVVGSTHRGKVGRIALGSTADRLLHGATCPVAVAPRGFAERMRGIDRVGVAFVDTEEGREALRAAATLAAACGAELHAATAVEPLPWSTTRLAAPIDVGAHLEHQREQAEITVRSALDRIRPAVRTHIDVLIDPPVVALERFSTDVDLLVCGSRGYGPLGSVLLGGVSRRLVHRAACPVVVVPRGTERVLEDLAGVLGEARHV